MNLDKRGTGIRGVLRYWTSPATSNICQHMSNNYVKLVVNFMVKCHFLHTKMYSEAVLMFAEHVYAVRKQMLRIEIAGDAI